MNRHEKRAIEQLEANKPIESVRESINLLFLEEHKQDWTNAKYEEYLAIFPITREQTEEEKQQGYQELLLEDENLLFEDVVFNPIRINYSENEAFQTFQDWLHGVNIITEYEAATYDENNNILTEEIKEVTEPIHNYVAPDNFDDEINSWLSNNTQNKERLDLIKKDKLSRLIVEVNGFKFYADNESRLDIIIAIQEAEKQGLTDDYTTMWKTADGISNVSLGDLRQVPKLALEMKAQIVGVN